MSYTKMWLLHVVLISSNKHQLLVMHVRVGSTKKLLRHMSSEYGVQIDELKISFPVNNNREVYYTCTYMYVTLCVCVCICATLIHNDYICVIEGLVLLSIYACAIRKIVIKRIMNSVNVIGYELHCMSILYV